MTDLMRKSASSLLQLSAGLVQCTGWLVSICFSQTEKVFEKGLTGYERVLIFFLREAPAVVITMICQIVLWIWFLGCTITYRAGKKLLVEGVGLKSAEFAVLCLYTLGIIAFHCFRPSGKWILFGILMLWFIVQFMCHWYFTIFGASERKLQGYNDCFRDSVRIFPMSDKRLIPDLYHIVLHILILINIVMCLI